MIGFPTDHRQLYETMRRQLLRDAGRRTSSTMPVEYMFKDGPRDGPRPRTTTRSPSPWRRWTGSGVEIGPSAWAPPPEARRASPSTQHPDRFVASVTVDPNRRRSTRSATCATPTSGWGVRAVSMFPAGVVPRCRSTHRCMYPIYATCIGLGIPVFVTVGHRRSASGERLQVVGCSIEDVLVRLPRARGRDAPRGRALGRPARSS